MCRSVKFPLSCIMDQISQNQPCITARQESKPKGFCLPKEQRHIFTEIQVPTTLEQKPIQEHFQGPQHAWRPLQEKKISADDPTEYEVLKVLTPGMGRISRKPCESFSIQFNSCSAEVFITGLFQGDSVYQDPHWL